MPSSTLTSKGQITVPKAIRERFSLVAGDVLAFIVDDDGRILVRPLRRGKGAFGVLREFAGERPVTVEEMDRAVRERAVGKSRPRE